MTIRSFLDLIYGSVYNIECTNLELADGVDLYDVLSTVLENLDYYLRIPPEWGCDELSDELAEHLPAIYQPSDEMVAEATKRKEEIAEKKKQLEDAEKLFGELPINKALFRVKKEDEYDDDEGEEDDDGCGVDDYEDDGNNDSLSTCLL